MHTSCGIVIIYFVQACAGAIIYVFIASLKDTSGSAENLVVGNIFAVACAIATGSYFALLRYMVVKDKYATACLL
jgi:hypothetical protein